MAINERFTVPYDRGKFFPTADHNYLEIWRLQRDKTEFFTAAFDTIDILDSFRTQISVMDNNPQDTDPRPEFIQVPYVVLDTASPNYYRKQPTMLGGFVKDPMPPRSFTSVVDQKVDNNGEQLEIQSQKRWYLHCNADGSKSYGYHLVEFDHLSDHFEVTIDDKAKTMTIHFESPSPYASVPHA